MGREVLCGARFTSAYLSGTYDAVIRMCQKGSLDVQSFAKNAGLYSERVGALHVVPPNKDAADRVKSQLSVLQRSEISNPPAHGARLVRTPLTVG